MTHSDIENAREIIDCLSTDPDVVGSGDGNSMTRSKWDFRRGLLTAMEAINQVLELPGLLTSEGDSQGPRKRMKVIYIAGPFRPKRKNDCWEMEQNIRRAEELAFEVWAAGAVALCPHMNTAHFQNALPDDVWLWGDVEMLGRCDAILMTPKWAESVGAICEHGFAEEHGMPVFYSVDELREWLDARRVAA